jgi:hypothetical protein
MGIDIATIIKPITDFLFKLAHAKEQVQQNHDNLFHSMLTIEEQLGKFIENQSMNEDILNEAIKKSRQNLEFLLGANKSLQLPNTSLLYNKVKELLIHLQDYLKLDSRGTYNDLKVYYIPCQQIVLSFRKYTRTYNVNSDHRNLRQLNSETYYKKRYFLLLSLMVIFLAALSNIYLFSKLKHIVFIRQPDKPKPTPELVAPVCSSASIKDTEALEKSRNMIIQDSNSKFFQVLEKELQEESNKTISIRHNKANLLQKAADYMHKYIKNHEKSGNTTRSNVFSRYLPLVRILENNALIDNTQSGFKIHIAVALSLSNVSEGVRGPDPPANSLLRGIDTAQRVIKKYNEEHKQSNPVFIKILLIDDTNANSTLLYPADEISNLTKNPTDDSTPITALIGHSDPLLSAKYYPCYKSNNLPVFTASILYGKTSFSNDIPSLLPSSNQIATNMIEFMRKRRSDHLLSDLPSKLVIYFDSKDSSSISLKDEICQAFQNVPSQPESTCDQKDIRDGLIPPSDKPFESELVLALNPNRNRFEEETKSILMSRIAPFKQAQIKNPNDIWIYVGPDYYDQNLIDSLQAFMDSELSKNKYDIRFSVFRIAPPDWRTIPKNIDNNPLRNSEYQKYYGSNHNWNGYNGFNSLIAYWQIISDLHPSANVGPNMVKKLRKNIIIRQENVTLTHTMPDKLLLKRYNGGYSLQGPGHKICEAPIIELSGKPMKSYGCI